MPPLSQLVTDLFAFTLQLLNREIKTNPLQPIFIHHSRLTQSLRLETVVFPTVSEIFEGIDIILAFTSYQATTNRLLTPCQFRAHELVYIAMFEQISARERSSAGLL